MKLKAAQAQVRSQVLHLLLVWEPSFTWTEDTLGHYKEKRSEHYNDIRWLSSFSILLQKLNHILLLQCNEKTELFVLSCVVTICSRGHSCLSGFISNIVKMPLTQCHISHWYTVLALFFTRSPHYSCSFCHVTISKKKNFS